MNMNAITNQAVYLGVVCYYFLKAIGLRCLPKNDNCIMAASFAQTSTFQEV